MADFLGFSAFKTHILEAGFVCIEQEDELGGEPSTITIPIAIWRLAVAQIELEIKEYEEFLQENLENE